MGNKAPLHLCALKSMTFFLSVLLGSGKGKDHDFVLVHQPAELGSCGRKERCVQLSGSSKHLDRVLSLVLLS